MFYLNSMQWYSTLENDKQARDKYIDDENFAIYWVFFE